MQNPTRNTLAKGISTHSDSRNSTKASITYQAKFSLGGGKCANLGSYFPTEERALEWSTIYLTRLVF